MKRLRREASAFEYRPLISVVVPVYNPEQRWLELALDSVLSQVYTSWELCVCDDGSIRKHVQEVLSRYERLDDRIKVKYLETNTGIAGASNAAVALATGEFVALLDHDDELSPDALFEVVKLLQDHPEADLIYSDEDKIDEAGQRSDPHFKPDWSPELLLCCNYVSHLGVYRRAILEEIGGFREGFEGSQDYDVVLRFTEKTQRIHHIPKVLYHWRAVPGSTAVSVDTKGHRTFQSTRRALAEALERRGIEGSVEDGPFPNYFRVAPTIKGNPRVSIIIPTQDNASLLSHCIESIERLSTYPNYEIVVVDNNSTAPDTLDYLNSTPHRVIQFKDSFNYSRINNFAINLTEGEYILLLNDDTEVISPEWLEAMLQHAQRPEIGAVGAKLLYPDDRVQHAGVVLGAGNAWGPGVADHSHRDYDSRHPSYMAYARLIRNYSAITAACMMLRRSVFEEVGGFDEENLQVAFNDVDLCLRIREKNYRIVYTPYAELYHYESASRGFGSGDPKEPQYLREHWGHILDNDPYYNPNFSLGKPDFNLRADMLSPRMLREPTEQQCDSRTRLHPLLIGRDEFKKHWRTQQQKMRYSPRTGLVRAPTEGSVDATPLNSLLYDSTAEAREDRVPSNVEPEDVIRGSEDSLCIKQSVWIFGSPRTGSTWLARMIAEQGNQVVWHEPYVGSLFGSFYQKEKDNAQLIKRSAFIMAEPYRRVWIRSIRNFIADSIAARYPQLGGGQFLFIKEPNGALGADLIMEAAPESRMVFLIRDSRDVIASWLEANKEGSWNEQSWRYDTSEALNERTSELAELYSRIVTIVRDAYSKHPGRKALVRYEDLRYDTFRALKEMYSALEIEVDDTQLQASIEKHRWEQIPDRSKGPGQFYRKAQPGGWKEDLSAEQVKIVEDITGPILREFYDLR